FATEGSLRKLARCRAKRGGQRPAWAPAPKARATERSSYSMGGFMAVEIRPIALKDAASYRRCWHAVAQERQYIYEDKAPPLAEVRKRLRKSLRKKTPFLVAVDGERVVGWAAVFRPGLPSLSHNGDFGIMLLPDYRGAGLGKKLTTGVLKMSRGKYDS